MTDCLIDRHMRDAVEVLSPAFENLRMHEKNVTGAHPDQIREAPIRGKSTNIS